MALFTDDFEDILNYYENQIAFYKSELDSAPAGKLYLQKNANGSSQLIYYRKENGSIIRQGVNKNEEIQRALARKEFARKTLEVLEPNVQAIKEAICKQRPFEPDDILKSMGKAYSLLPEEFFFNSNDLRINLKLDDEKQARIDRHIQWGMQTYKESWFHPENKTKRTSTGRYVRSKSEQLIFESLLNAGIPNHYDEEHRINGLFVVTDFTFERFDNELFFWDHFGMMDNPKYAKRSIRKLEDYYDAGLIPGDNLILTFSKGDDINMGTIKSVIINEVLPRL